MDDETEIFQPHDLVQVIGEAANTASGRQAILLTKPTRELTIDSDLREKMASLFQDLEKGFLFENIHGSWTTVLSLCLMIVFHCFFAKKNFFSLSRFQTSVLESNSFDLAASPPPQNPLFRIPGVVTNDDLKFLIENLAGNTDENERWENVIDKKNDLVHYKAKCCKPKNGPLKYSSVTVFEDCLPEMLKDFYMDNDYRKSWDKTVVLHEQLQVDETCRVEVGRTVKKFPLLTPREYVLSWRLWEGRDRTFYCFIKECEHPQAPLQKKYVRVKIFRSGWRIRKVSGRNACEIKMVHQEDAGLNVEMAKLAFAKGIWSFICKMDLALRKYNLINHPHPISAVSAVTLISKVPPEIDVGESSQPTTVERGPLSQMTDEGRKLNKRSSRKLVANGLLLVGGLICLSQGGTSLGSKVGLVFILTKLRKRNASAA